MMFFFFFLIIDIALIDAASWRTTTVPTSKKAAATKLTRKSIPRTTSGSRSIGKTKVGPPVNDEMKAEIERLRNEIDKYEDSEVVCNWHPTPKRHIYIYIHLYIYIYIYIQMFPLKCPAFLGAIGLRALSLFEATGSRKACYLL